MLSPIGRIDTPLPAAEAIVIGLLAFIVVNGRILWSVANHAETVLHEGAHALIGIAAGRRIRGVDIDRDGGGGTPSGSRASPGVACSSASELMSSKLIRMVKQSATQR